MQNITISLNIMDTTPTAAIAAIAAVAFDPDTGKIGNQLYYAIDLESSSQNGGSIGATSVKKWLTKSAEERSEILADGAVTIQCAMSELEYFILRNSNCHLPHIWMRNANRNASILTSAMERINFVPSWTIHNIHDIGTLERAATAARSSSLSKIPHEHKPPHVLNAAIYQTRIIIHIWQTLVKPHQQDQQL